MIKTAANIPLIATADIPIYARVVFTGIVDVSL